MDLNTAISICIGIFVAGGVSLKIFSSSRRKVFSNNNGKEIVPRKELDNRFLSVEREFDGVSQKFRKVMFRDTCDPLRQNLVTQIKSTEKLLLIQMKANQKNLNDALAAINKKLG